MANIIITSVCNRNCVYCFANVARDRNRCFGQFMSSDVFEQTLQVIKKSEIFEVRILGGEPTQHPKIVDFVNRSLEIFGKVKIFTNGVMEREIIELFTAMGSERLSFILNIDRLDQYPNDQREKLLLFLELCHDKILPGTTISSKTPDLDYLVDIINGFGLVKKVRIGISQPDYDFDNCFLLSKYYRTVGDRIVDFAEFVHTKDIRVILDCGFVPCMFQQEGEIANQLQMQTIRKPCVPVLDILPDGRVIPCFPLFDLSGKQISEAASLTPIRKVMERELFCYQSIDLFPECTVCLAKKKRMCKGGCVAMKRHRMNRIEQDGL